ncbi:hypothetical protein [Jidongwangia harbinensis]|uniref:hypothetical protein n=1 Tax=Jidongwangia harbinensis TaxID=2878561 RepID=UPI001CD9FC39|nr:hypothetical protein [Jidongwangia harbinensis]MCA2213007.1 hypothetical protein [Jidongwangia harbinensis]
MAIIGSFRKHHAEVVAAGRAFRSQGIDVMSPPDSEVLDPSLDFVRFASDPTSLADHELQARALHRILSASFVYAVLPGGYLGRTSGFEMGQVIRGQVPLFFSDFPPVDLPILVHPSAVVDAATLAGEVAHEGPQVLRKGHLEVRWPMISDDRVG